MEINKEVENPSARNSAGLPDYQAQVPNDEIDLVDFWLYFWDQRKIFCFSMTLIVVVGMVYFEMLYESKQVVSVRSIIEISCSSPEGRG